MRAINLTINYRASRGIESKSLEACNETSFVYSCRCSHEILRLLMRPRYYSPLIVWEGTWSPDQPGNGNQVAGEGAICDMPSAASRL